MFVACRCRCLMFLEDNRAVTCSRNGWSSSVLLRPMILRYEVIKIWKCATYAPRTLSDSSAIWCGDVRPKICYIFVRQVTRQLANQLQSLVEQAAGDLVNATNRKCNLPQILNLDLLDFRTVSNGSSSSPATNKESTQRANDLQRQIEDKKLKRWNW